MAISRERFRERKCAKTLKPTAVLCFGESFIVKEPKRHRFVVIMTEPDFDLDPVWTRNSFLFLSLSPFFFFSLSLKREREFS